MTRSLATALLAIALCTAGPAAHAVPIVYTAILSGPSEDPPNASPGTGFAEVDFDIVAHTLRVQVTFSGLTGTTTAAHIHAPTPTPGTGIAGVATQLPSFSGFPLGVTSGSYDQTFVTCCVGAEGTYNPAFLTAHGGTAAGAEAALDVFLAEGRAYLNIHTTTFPGGEIRGFLVPLAVAVAEPGPLVLLALGLIVFGVVERTKHTLQARGAPGPSLPDQVSASASRDLRARAL
jgi:hypothetical protein